MNRVLLCGIAIFFAVVGVALLGGDNSQAVAGHGCCGCSGAADCCGAVDTCCGAADTCCGRPRLFSRLHRRCHGCNGCSGSSCSGCGGAPSCSGGCGGAEAAPAAPPAPAAPAEAPKATSLQRTPFGFRTVSFVR